MIEVKVPKEIKDYEERLIFGLSIRKFGWASLAAIIICGLFVLLYVVLDVPSAAANMVIFAAASPIIAFGFVKVRGQRLSLFLIKVLSFTFSDKIYKYSTKGWMHNDTDAATGKTGNRRKPGKEAEWKNRPPSVKDIRKSRRHARLAIKRTIREIKREEAEKRRKDHR